jgi:hypothetical protein
VIGARAGYEDQVVMDEVKEETEATAVPLSRSVGVLLIIAQSIRIESRLI